MKITKGHPDYEREDRVDRCLIAATSLMAELRDAHKVACYKNGLLEILLLDLIDKAAGIRNQIKNINEAMKGE